MSLYPALDLPFRVAFVGFLSFVASLSWGADVYSPVFGFVKYDCPAGNDTVVSVPFHPAPRWAGRLLSAPADQGGGVVRLALKDTPGFAAGELTDNKHLLLCRDAAGPEGRHFPVVAHGADTVDVTATLADLTGLAIDGLVSVIPAWTLASLFPPDTQTTLHPSTGPLASERGSELLFFDGTTAGTSLAPSRRFYVTDSGWFEVGSFTDAGEVALSPGQAFLIRHQAGVDATEFVANQQVYGAVVSLAIPVSTQTARDTVIAPPRPVAITLADLDFGSGQFVESTTTAPGDRKDQILVYDNASPPGLNKAPSATYFRSGGQWLRDNNNTFPVSNTVEIEPSTGLILRKAIGGADETLRWANAPTYDVTAP